MKREVIYIFVLALLVLMFFNSSFEIKRKGFDSVKIDTIKVIKIIPKIEKVFETVKPKPIYITKTNDKQLKNIIKKLEAKYNQKADSVTILRELLQATAIRKYTETFEDSLLVATVNAETSGVLNSIDFKYTKKPQKITYFETTTTKTLTPKFALFLGGKVNTTSNLEKSSFEVNLGAQLKNGSIFELGYNTNSQLSLGYKRRLFVKY